jgi:hypothetical protein
MVIARTDADKRSEAIKVKDKPANSINLSAILPPSEEQIRLRASGSSGDKTLVAGNSNLLKGGS